jgi:hypothetical protein
MWVVYTWLGVMFFMVFALALSIIGQRGTGSVVRVFYTGNQAPQMTLQGLPSQIAIVWILRVWKLEFAIRTMQSAVFRSKMALSTTSHYCSIVL